MVASSQGANSLHTVLSTWSALGFSIAFLVFGALRYEFGFFKLDLFLLPLILIYLWPRQPHRYLHIWGVFLIGMAMDLLSGGPLGLWTLSSMIMSIIMRPSLSELKSGSGSRWVGFMIFSGLTAVLAYLLSRLSLAEWPPVIPLVFQLASVLVIFPVVLAVRGIFKREIAGRSF